MNLRSAALLFALVPSAALANPCAYFLNTDQPDLYAQCMANEADGSPAIEPETRRQLQALPGLSADPYGMQTEQQRIYQSDPGYRAQHDQNMIMNHGGGGCTPNFATGGCL